MKIKAAVIGSGIGIKHLEAIKDYKKSIVKIICEKNPNKVKNLKKKFKNIQIISNDEKIFKNKEINLVSIASYDDDHFSQLVKCIKNNKHIIVEKPMCLKSEQLVKIKNLIKKKPNVKIISNLVLRTNTLFKKLRENIDYKNIFYVEADYIWGRKEKLFQWRSNIKDYSITLGAGIHVIDLAMWLIKKKPIYVTAFGNKVITTKSRFKKNSFIVYIFEFPLNIIVKITANAVGIYKHFHEVKIFEKNKTQVHNYLGSYKFAKQRKKTLFKELKYNYPDKKNRKKLIHNFIDFLIDSKNKPIITLKEQFDLMSVCFASDQIFMKNIKFSKLNVTDKDIKTVGKIIKSGWLTHGKFTTDFEDEFKKFTNSKYAISVSSCTAGLHLSCLAAGFNLGDEVIVPAQTHTATAHAVEYTGAKVKLADVDLITGNLSLNDIKKNITKKTKGVIVVHMAGYPCEMDKILNFCKKNKLILLEDCAHAVGTKFKKRHVGNFGLSGSFSFYPTKQITTGEGGMVVTNDKKFYKKIKALKAFGIDKDINDRKKQGEYDVKLLGYNYRMTDFQAALGLSQIKKYAQNLKQRHIIVKRYIKNFFNIKKIKHMPYSAESSFFIFQIFCKNRDFILRELKRKNIGVSVHYSNALPLMTYYKKKYNLNLNKFKNANNYGKTNISLPVYPKLKISEIDKICKTIIGLI